MTLIRWGRDSGESYQKLPVSAISAFVCREIAMAAPTAQFLSVGIAMTSPMISLLHRARTMRMLYPPVRPLAHLPHKAGVDWRLSERHQPPATSIQAGDVMQHDYVALPLVFGIQHPLLFLRWKPFLFVLKEHIRRRI